MIARMKVEGAVANMKKFIVVIVILIAIGGIWAVKNSPVDPEAEASDSDSDLHVTAEIDLEELKSHGIPIIIDFGADSCIPCKEMAPVLRELNQDLQGKAIIRFVDVWKYPDLARGYPITVIPTQVFINAEGKPYVPENPNAMPLKQYKLKDTDEHVFTTHEGGMTKEQMLAVLKDMGMK